MDKRVTGVTVIVAGLLAVLVLGGLQGRMTAGEARHGPSVRTGDCAQVVPTPGPGDVSDILRVPVPVASWTSCATAGAGTVIGVSDLPQLPETETAIGYRQLMDECRKPLQTYLFSSLGSDYSWDVTGSHLTFEPLTSVVAVPARPAAAGAAGVCVLARPVDQQYAGVVVDPALPGNALGVCVTSWADRQPVSCDRPHAVELMAQVTDRRIRLGMDLRGRDGCAAFLSLATGRPDPTFSGQLGVLIDPVPPDEEQPVMCGLGVMDPSRSLGRSLIGIDDREIPWA